MKYFTVASVIEGIATVLKGIFGILGIQWWKLADLNPRKKKEKKSVLLTL